MEAKYIDCSVHKTPAKLHHNKNGQLTGIECPNCNLLLKSPTLDLRWAEEEYKLIRKLLPHVPGPEPNAHITFPNQFTVRLPTPLEIHRRFNNGTPQ